jgi:hypothetical protein
MAEQKRVVGRLLLVANLAFANVAAALGVVAFVRPTIVGLPTDGFGGAFGELRVLLLPLGTAVAWAVFLAAMALLLANFAWLVRRPERTPPRNYVVSETPTGTVRVTREAIESGLRAAGEALPEITRLRISVDPAAPKRVLVTGHFLCAEGVNNLGASQRLRTVLQDRFDEIVRPAEGTRVDFELEFLGFQGRLTKKAAESAAADAPFTGPKYPIEEEDAGGAS